MISIDSVGYPDLAEDNDIKTEKNSTYCDYGMPQFGNPKAAAAIKQFVNIQENIECLNMRIKYLEEMKSRLAAKPEVLKG